MKKLFKYLIMICGVAIAVGIGYLIVIKPSSPGFIYPVNMEMNSEMGDSSVMASYKVSYDNKRDVFIYNYKLAYNGENEIIIRWDIFNHFRSNKPHLLLMKKGSVQEFIFESKKSPVVKVGKMLVYEKKKEGRFVVMPKIIEHPGPVPID